jgi:hypothetical protein
MCPGLYCHPVYLSLKKKWIAELVGEQTPTSEGGSYPASYLRLGCLKRFDSTRCMSCAICIQTARKHDFVCDLMYDFVTAVDM